MNAIADGLIATVGLAAGFFVNAAVYMAVIASLLLMRGVESRPPALISMVAALREGVAYVFGHRWPRALIIIVASFSIFGFSFLPLMPVFARDVIHVEASGYGVLVAAIGAGERRPHSFWPGLETGYASPGWCSAHRCCSVSPS